ncbi:MAG: hypothetical protein IJ911_12720 [Salinivirgaceae bacterium]|nr:hypothetical protein [Salinivirgaceae bacterium]
MAEKKTIQDKSIFSSQQLFLLGGLFLSALRKPIDVRVVVDKVDDLFIISGDDLKEENQDNVAYDGIFVWVKSERAFYVYDELESDGLIYPQRDANDNPYTNVTDPDPNPRIINGVAVQRYRTKWKKYAVQSLSSETAAEADRLKETRLIQGHAFDGTQSVESGLFYPEELTLTAQENSENPTNAAKTIYLKEKIKTTNQSGFYYGSYPDGSGSFGLEVVYMGGGTIIRDDKGNITAINGGRYRRTLTEFVDGKISVYTTTTDGNEENEPQWELQLHPCSVKRVNDFTIAERYNSSNVRESGIFVNEALGDDFAEKWLFIHKNLPQNTKFIRDSKGFEFDFTDATANVVAQPYYVILQNLGNLRKAEIVSTRATADNHGFVRLTDDIADDDNTAERGGVAASPKAVSTVNGYLIEHQQCGEDENQQAIFAKGKASGARFGHVVISDIETAAELEKDKNAATAATPKGVKTVVDKACATKADLTDIAPDFDPAATYAVGDLVTHNGDLYRCIKPHRDETAFDTYAEMVQEVFGGWDMEHNYADGEFVKGNKSSQQQTPVRKLLHPIVFEEIEVEEFSLTGTYEAGKYIKWANLAIYLTTQSLDILNLVDFFNRYVQVVDGETTETTFSYSNNYNIGKTVKIGDKVYRFQRKYQASTIRQILDQNCTPLRLLGNVDTWFSKANFSIINGDVFNNATDLYQSGRFFKYVGETYTNHSTVEQDSIAQFAGLESAEADKYFYQEADREHTYTDIQIFSLYRFKETYPLQFNRFFDRVTVDDELNREAAARATADSDEATARAAADEALQDNINDEAATRENADLVLGERLTQHADTKATAAVSAHVRLSDSDYQPELDVYEHVAATPKAVSTKANTTTLAAEFDPTATYAVGDLVTRRGNLYHCIDGYADPNVFENNFVQVDSDAAIDIEKAYAVDDFAIINNNLYRCKSAVDLTTLLPKIATPYSFGSQFNYAEGNIVEWQSKYYLIQADCTHQTVISRFVALRGTNKDKDYYYGYPVYNPQNTYDYVNNYRLKIYDEQRNVWCFYEMKSVWEGTNRINLTPARLTEWLTANAQQLTIVESFGLNTVISGKTIVKLDDSIYYYSDDEATLNVSNHFEQLSFKEVMAAPAGVIPALNIGGAYTAGDWVADGGKNYQCVAAVDFTALLETVAVTTFGSRYNYQKGDIVTWLGVHYRIMDNCTLYAPLTESGFFTYKGTENWDYEQPDLDLTSETHYSPYSVHHIWDEKKNIWQMFRFTSGTYTPACITEWLAANAYRITFKQWNIQSSVDNSTLFTKNGVIYGLTVGAEAFSVGDFFLAPDAMTDGGELTTQRGEFIKRAGVIYRSLYNFPASFAQMFELVKVGTMLLAETAERRAAVAAEETARKNTAVTLQNNIDTEAAALRQAAALLDIKIDDHTAQRASDSTFGHVSLIDDIDENAAALDGSFAYAATPKAVYEYVRRYVNEVVNGIIEANTKHTYRARSGWVSSTEIDIDEWIGTRPETLREGDMVVIEYTYESFNYSDISYVRLYLSGHSGTYYMMSTQRLYSMWSNYHGQGVITYEVIGGKLEVKS